VSEIYSFGPSRIGGYFQGPPDEPPPQPKKGAKMPPLKIVHMQSCQGIKVHVSAMQDVQYWLDHSYGITSLENVTMDELESFLRKR
jgi:hypothetical protein